MNQTFSPGAKADRFANRAKHHEWDASDIEAVWDEARMDLIAADLDKFQSGDDYEPSRSAIEARCLEILEKNRG